MADITVTEQDYEEIPSGASAEESLLYPPNKEHVKYLLRLGDIPEWLNTLITEKDPEVNQILAELSEEGLAYTTES